jgi:hypothetical protein
MKQICEKIIAQPKLRTSCVWVTHCCEQATLQPVIRFAFPSHEIAILEEPPFGLGGDLLAMAADMKVESTMRKEIWEDKFSGRLRGSFVRVERCG